MHAARKMAGLQARGETLWPLMEEDTYIPDDLKLILRATKFDNLYALSRFDMVKDIQSIESFMQNTLHTLIPPSEYEEYYDIFKGQPKNFVLVGGHRVALKLLVERSKAIIASNKKRFNSDVDNGSSDNNNSTSSSKRSKESKTSTSDDICKAKVTLQNSLKSYIKDHYPSLQETEIICSVGKDGFGSLVAQANCCVPDCKEVRKISRNETRWNTTNYYTHVRTHFATGRTTNKKSGKKFKRIDSMFEHIGGKSRNTKSVAPSNSSDVEDEPGMQFSYTNQLWK